jgi:glutathione synthase/RimK-type ligase-like ATP-grasp enzyme
MNIAIHHTPGSFSDRWISYCKENNIAYKIVNCYDNDIVAQLDDCDALMWHHHHGNYKDVLFAKQLLYSLQAAGKKVFPDFNTAWHFDDKVGQKYLLESIGAPLVPSYVFYTKKDALNWIDKTTFPKVFKLRGGAGATNVKLIKTRSEARKLAKIAFGRGFSQFNRWNNLSERIRRFKEGKDNIIGILKGIGRLFIPTEFAKMYPREKGYVYFQEFIPNNNFDIRIIVVGDKAFAIKRFTRQNDFRASGSGNIVYENNHIDERCVQIAFNVNSKLICQSIAYDFVFDDKNNPLIIEISYGFATVPYDQCPGYWDSSLKWHEGKFNPQEWMVQNLLCDISIGNSLS